MKKNFATAAVILALGSLLALVPAFAQDHADPKQDAKMHSKMGKMDDKMGKMDGKMDKMDGKMGKMQHQKKMSKDVFVCKECKTYYSAATAKKMKNKDSMGHMMQKMKSAPKGYMNGDKMKGKM